MGAVSDSGFMVQRCLKLRLLRGFEDPKSPFFRFPKGMLASHFHADQLGAPERSSPEMIYTGIPRSKLDPV